MDPVSPSRISTGIAGVDNLLAGGLPRRGLYLLEGAPGTGKTTFALQFLLAGVAANERALLVALSETAGEVREFAETHGWSLDGIEIMDLNDLQAVVDETGRQTVFHHAEVEFTKLTNLIAERIEKTKAVRVAIDSLAELRHLAEEESIYRLQMETLKPILLGNDRTILMVDEALHSGTIHTLAQGVIGISYSVPEFGPYRRHLSIQKLRGVKFKEGLHDFEILTGGIVVYPRLVASEHRLSETTEQISSGISAFDSILGGGLDRGTSTIFMGPAGSGKSILATRVALAAAERGEKATVYAFEESLATLDKPFCRAWHGPADAFGERTFGSSLHRSFGADAGKVCRHRADGRRRRGHHDRYRQLDRLHYIRGSCGRHRPANSESAFFSRAAKRHDFVGFRPAWSAWLCGRANRSDELSRGHGGPVALL